MKGWRVQDLWEPVVRRHREAEVQYIMVDAATRCLAEVIGFAKWLVGIEYQ